MKTKKVPKKGEWGDTRMLEQEWRCLDGKTSRSGVNLRLKQWEAVGHSKEQNA